MDSFIEYLIEQKRTTGTKIKKFLIYSAALMLSLVIAFFMFLFPSAVMYIPAIIAILFYGAYRITSSYNVEFEYILTNGELDIDKIVSRKRRKRLLTIHCKAFIEFGKYTSANKNDENKNEYSRIINASANSKTYDDYYAIFFKNGQKVKLIFNPTQKMIDIFKVFAPRAMKLDN